MLKIESQLELEAPVYPKDYYDFRCGTSIPNDRINEWLNRAFAELREEMLRNPDSECGSYYIASGDSKVYVFYHKQNDGKYNVVFDVSRSYFSYDISDFDPGVAVDFISVK